jgi:hypothetical protein
VVRATPPPLVLAMVLVVPLATPCLVVVVVPQVPPPLMSLQARGLVRGLGCLLPRRLVCDAHVRCMQACCKYMVFMWREATVGGITVCGCIATHTSQETEGGAGGCVCDVNTISVAKSCVPHSNKELQTWCFA